MSSIKSLEAYRAQKSKRKRIREKFIQKMLQLEKRIYALTPQSNLNHVSEGEQIFNDTQERKQQKSELERNNKFRAELLDLEEQERLKIADFRCKFDGVKNLYLAKIRQISEEGKKYKEQYQTKIMNLNTQYSLALKKSNEIEAFNQKLEGELSESTNLSQKYIKQIEQQYAEKLKQFEAVFEASSQKIREVQKKMGYEELVEATLANEQLIREIKQSAQKNELEIDRIYGEYVELLGAKQEIVAELRENNEMKQKQVANSSILEGKLKHILSKLSEEREIYIDQNKKMSNELLQIQALLEKVMGSALE